LINRALREHVESSQESLKETLRSVVREELAKYGKNEGTSLTKRSSGPAKSAGC
jgi:di/tripeptidase